MAYNYYVLRGGLLSYMGNLNSLVLHKTLHPLCPETNLQLLEWLFCMRELLVTTKICESCGFSTTNSLRVGKLFKKLRIVFKSRLLKTFQLNCHSLEPSLWFKLKLADIQAADFLFRKDPFRGTHFKTILLTKLNKKPKLNN